MDERRTDSERILDCRKRSREAETQWERAIDARDFRSATEWSRQKQCWDRSEEALMDRLRHENPREHDKLWEAA